MNLQQHASNDVKRDHQFDRTNQDPLQSDLPLRGISRDAPSIHAYPTAAHRRARIALQRMLQVQGSPANRQSVSEPHHAAGGRWRTSPAPRRTSGSRSVSPVPAGATRRQMICRSQSKCFPALRSPLAAPQPVASTHQALCRETRSTPLPGVDALSGAPDQQGCPNRPAWRPTAQVRVHRIQLRVRESSRGDCPQEVDPQDPEASERN